MQYNPQECSQMQFSYEEFLINSINSCKKKINSDISSYTEKEELIEMLVESRWKLFIKKDAEQPLVHGPQFLGHTFVIESKKRVMPHFILTEICEICHLKIHHMFKKILICSNCHILIHKSCIKCLAINSLWINLKICPEIGLSKQDFRCGFCKTYLPKIGLKHCRKCDYSGLHYCLQCHVGDLHAIPARIIRNWDFSLYPVHQHNVAHTQIARQAFTLLEMIWTRKVIRLSYICDHLFNNIPILAQTSVPLYILHIENKKKIIRNKFLHPKMSQHSDYTYTFQDLYEIHTGELIKTLNTLKIKCFAHVTKECIVFMVTLKPRHAAIWDIFALYVAIAILYSPLALT
ncbi:hypothetical protein MXB_368 [Myxobolus squamalis]|nr:hypothetical protein MXB_368 [Myxobolus squamalis]